MHKSISQNTPKEEFAMKHLPIMRLYFTFFCSLFLTFNHIFAGSIPENAPFTTPSGENVSEAGPLAVCLAYVYVAVGSSCDVTLTPAMIDGGSSDADGDPLTFSLDNPGPYNPGVYTVFLTVSDGSSTNQCWSTVTVEDKISPTAICVSNVNVSLGPDGTITALPEYIDAGSFDNCDIDLSISSGPTEFDCSDVGETFTLFLTVEDVGGNTNTCFSEVSIVDPGGFCENEAPVAVCLDGLSVSVGGDCESPLLFPADFDAGSFDPDGDPLTYSIDNEGPFAPGTYNVTLTVSDGSLSNSCFTEVQVTTPNNTTYEWIETVAVADLDNNSGDNGGYADFTALSTTLAIGNNYEIALTPGYAASTYTERWRVYIDFNEDGVFSNPAERVAQTQGVGPQLANILLPEGTLTGTTTMRVVMSYGDFENTCDDDFEGEVEDYTVVIANCEDVPGCISYCESEGQNTSYEWIRRVRLRSINNNSGDDGGYGDYTALSTNVTTGSTYNMRLRPGFSGSSYQEYWRVWVDWNQDGSFSAGELMVQENDNGNIITSLTVPTAALAGPTRMRVAMQYNQYANACDNFGDGEVEDYTVNVVSTAGLIVSEDEIAQAETTNEVKQQSVNNSNDESPQLAIAIPDARTLGLQLAPNPAKDVVNVSVNPLFENAELRIIDQVGRVVWYQTWNVDQQSQMLDLQSLGLANGVYFVSLQTTTEKITKRLVVAK